MKVSVVSYSLSHQPSTLKEWELHLLTEIKKFLEDGSKIILYPELFLMGLSDYFPGTLQEQYLQIAAYTKEKLLPRLSGILQHREVFLCLGSGPRREENKIYNSCPIWMKDTWTFQDKIHLTPWETDFTAGSTVRFFSFHGLQLACLICFDIEQPGLALKLKRHGVDLLLVPSATSNRNGSQRVNRCASARSVELGALVITAPLVGDSKCELVDHNEGRQGFFLPSQEAVTMEQELYSDYSVQEQLVSDFEFEVDMLRQLKRRDDETKPYFKEDLILS